MGLVDVFRWRGLASCWAARCWGLRKAGANVCSFAAPINMLHDPIGAKTCRDGRDQHRHEFHLSTRLHQCRATRFSSIQRLKTTMRRSERVPYLGCTPRNAKVTPSIRREGSAINAAAVRPCLKAGAHVATMNHSAKSGDKNNSARPDVNNVAVNIVLPESV